MKLGPEQLKAIDLVAFCERCYGLKFRRQGHVFVCLSPFQAEHNASFVVHHKQGQWLFKDFSSGKGGSIIDLVRDLENLPNDYAAIVARLMTLLEARCAGLLDTVLVHPRTSPVEPKAPADLPDVFSKIRSNPLEPSRQYLESRAIASRVIDNLVQREQLFTNVYAGKTYCCFAVRNAHRQLMCLDNHEIGGPEKFVLGTKHVFVPDYQALAQAREVTITEGISDLLSMETLFKATGLALLGAGLDFPAELIAASEKIVLALDNDDAGDAGKEKLMARFPDKQFEPFSVGDYKDPNEVLMAFPNIATKRKKFSPEEKLEIYEAVIRGLGKSHVARQFGIDRSYLNEILTECKQAVVAHFASKKAGRKKANALASLGDALEQIEHLEAEKLELAKTKEELYIANEFLKLRLSWAETDHPELKNRHFKKKNEEKPPIP